MTLPTKRINVSITGEEAELIEKLQASFYEKHSIRLSAAELIKKLLRLAAEVEFK